MINMTTWSGLNIKNSFLQDIENISGVWLFINPISHGVKQDPPSHGGGDIMTTGLKKYFLTDSWLFLYTYQLCYISGPPMQKELNLASKLWICGPFKN